MACFLVAQAYSRICSNITTISIIHIFVDLSTKSFEISVTYVPVEFDELGRTKDFSGSLFVMVTNMKRILIVGISGAGKTHVANLVRQAT